MIKVTSVSGHGKERDKERMMCGDVNAVWYIDKLIGGSTPPSCESAICAREEFELPGRSIRLVPCRMFAAGVALLRHREEVHRVIRVLVQHA